MIITIIIIMDKISLQFVDDFLDVWKMMQTSIGNVNITINQKLLAPSMQECLYFCLITSKLVVLCVLSLLTKLFFLSLQYLEHLSRRTCTIPCICE